jgi:hypothetical protein
MIRGAARRDSPPAPDVNGRARRRIRNWKTVLTVSQRLERWARWFQPGRPFVVAGATAIVLSLVNMPDNAIYDVVDVLINAVVTLEIPDF